LNIYKTSSDVDVANFVNGATTAGISAPTGGTGTELTGGFTLALTRRRVSTAKSASSGLRAAMPR
jgi:fibronectin-binding autotransporter adhesin